MQFLFEVTSGSHYPIKTEGRFESGSWPKAARLAEEAHRAHLRESNRLRKHGESVVIRLTRVG